MGKTRISDNVSSLPKARVRSVTSVGLIEPQICREWYSSVVSSDIGNLPSSEHPVQKTIPKTWTGTLGKTG